MSEEKLKASDEMFCSSCGAVIKKFSDNYDHLQFLIYEDGKESVYFNLSKIAGEGENKK